jgi:serine/threonine-protein kinase
MGVILGTAAYMSPEQARGRPVDKRADIWALGVVLYEMLTGQRPFVGEDVSLTLAEVMKGEPDWNRLPPETPQPIQRLVRRCLEKAPERRLRDIGDARLEIEEALAGGVSWVGSGARPRPGGVVGAGSLTASPGVRPLLLSAIGVAFAGAALGFVMGRGGDRSGSRPSMEGHPLFPTRTVVNLPESALLALGTEVPLGGFDSPVVALSPDGRHLVYVGQSEKGTRLYHRDLTRFDEPRPIPGTEGALHALFSPDSAEVGFLTADRVRKVALAGGAVTTLCRALTPVLASWVGDTVYYTDREGSVLNGVAAGGGEPAVLLDVTKRYGIWGQVSSVLPGSRAALLSVTSPDATRFDYAEIHVLSLDGREDRALGITGSDARYLPSGHLVFARGGNLMAAPFDLERLELLGPAVPVLTDVAVHPTFAQVHAAFADNGAIAFVPGRDLGLGRLAWIDRRGREGWFDVDERAYQSFDVGPDDRRVAVQVADVRDYVWVWDNESGGRDLGGPGLVGWPVWSPDGRDLALTRRTPGSSPFEIVRHELESGATERLASSEFEIRPESWVRGGRLGISEWGRSNPRVGRLDVASGSSPQWVRPDPGEDFRGSWGAALSPDGTWVAYASQGATGRYQIWLEELGGETRRQVSTDGGLEPVWCRRCDELFYRRSDRILASRITLAPRLEIGAPSVVFEAPDFVDTPGVSFRVSSDGQRLYYVRRSRPPARDRIHIIQNWFSELQQLAPTSH